MTTIPTDTTDGGWIGVDLDGTLAEYHGWQGGLHIGPPIAPMVERVRAHLAARDEVRIFTARAAAWTEEEHDAMREWCRRVLGCELMITCVKDCRCARFYDDRAVQVVTNTGRLVEEELEQSRTAHRECLLKIREMEADEAERRLREREREFAAGALGENDNRGRRR